MVAGSQSAGERPSWVDEDMFPFQSRFLELDGHLVHYVDEGSGPVLLMLHGNPAWSFEYRQVIAALRGQFRCVAPDYPGFGLSVAGPGYRYRPEDHARVMLDFLGHLGLTAVTLAVHDWGGPIGLWVAQQRPQAFTALVIGNTWAWPVNGDLHFEVFSHLMGGMLGRQLIRHFNLFVNMMIPAGHRRRKLTAAEMAQYRSALPTPVRREASAIFPRAITASRDFLAEIEAGMGAVTHLPALILWADADFAFRASERQKWESLFPHHTTVTLAGAGHYLQSDAPAEYAAAIRTWHAALDNPPR